MIINVINRIIIVLCKLHNSIMIVETNSINYYFLMVSAILYTVVKESDRNLENNIEYELKKLN